MQAHKRASELDGARKEFTDKSLGEVEHVACGYTRTPLSVNPDITAYDEAISPEYEACFRIPDYKLTTWRVHSVKLVDVDTFTRAAACCPE